MRSSRRRWAVGTGLVLLALLALIAAVVWWFDRHTSPNAVGPRFTEKLLARRPGTTVDGWSAGVMRIALPSGTYMHLRLAALFDECRADRFGCSSAIDRALDDVDQIDRATRDPQRAMLRPMLVSDPVPGAALGYVTEPFVAHVELRYALVHGIATTFVTSSIADRLALSRPALKAAAIAALYADPAPELEALPGNEAVYRVRSVGDPGALLLDHEQMKSFATRLATKRVYAALPGTGVMYLAKGDAAGADALTRIVLTPGAIGRFDLLAYDVDAPEDSALTIATRPR
jgi:hypothetical protein